MVYKLPELRLRFLGAVIWTVTLIAGRKRTSWEKQRRAFSLTSSCSLEISFYDSSKRRGLQKVATTSRRNLSERPLCECVCLKRRTKVCPKVLLLVLGGSAFIHKWACVHFLLMIATRVLAERKSILSRNIRAVERCAAWDRAAVCIPCASPGTNCRSDTLMRTRPRAAIYLSFNLARCTKVSPPDRRTLKKLRSAAKNIFAVTRCVLVMRYN